MDENRAGVGKLLGLCGLLVKLVIRLCQACLREATRAQVGIMDVCLPEWW